MQGNRACGIGMLVWLAMGIATPSLGEDAARRAGVAALSDTLARDPADAEALLRLARASIALREYEPAIAALERLLAFRPDLAEARVELAAGYYALGADQVAEIQFRRALEALAPDSREAARARAYLTEIARRNQPDRLSGSIALGLGFATNPGLDGDTDLFFGFPVAGAEADTAAFGPVLHGTLTHRHDLGRADADVWLTEAAGSLWAYTEAEDRRAAVTLRTGPLLTLDGSAYGPKIRPFLLLEAGFEADQLAFAGYGGGAELVAPVTADWSLALTGLLVSRDFASEFPGHDGLRGRTLATLNWTPTRDEALRLSVFWHSDDAAADFNASERHGVRLVGETAFALDLPGVIRPAELDVWVEWSRRRFDGINEIVSPLLRQDDSLRGGAALSLFFDGGWFARAMVEIEDRQSNHRDADATDLRAELTFGLRF